MAAVLEAVLLFAAPSFIPVTLAYLVIALMYFGAGVRAWWRRPGSMMGPLIVVGGVAMLVAGLINTEIPPLVMVGHLSATLIVAVIIHLLLAFPSGQLRGRLPWLVAAIAYLSTTVAQATFVLFDGAVADLGHIAQRVGGALMIIGTVIVLTGRLRAASREQRRTLLPLTAYGMAVVVFIPSGPTLMRLLFDATPLEIGVAQLVGIAGIPLAFLAAVMRGAFAPTAEAEALAAWLSAGPDRPRTREVLARALGDPTVTLAYRPTDGSGFVDGEGRPATVPQPGSRPRDTVFVEVAVPTSVTLRAPERLAPDMARTAYFLVAEALANVTKHSRPAASASPSPPRATRSSWRSATTASAGRSRAPGPG